MNIDIVLEDIATNILKPNTEDETINNLYCRGK